MTATTGVFSVFVGTLAVIESQLYLLDDSFRVPDQMSDSQRLQGMISSVQFSFGGGKVVLRRTRPQMDP